MSPAVESKPSLKHRANISELTALNSFNSEDALGFVLKASPSLWRQTFHNLLEKTAELKTTHHSFYQETCDGRSMSEECKADKNKIIMLWWSTWINLHLATAEPHRSQRSPIIHQFALDCTKHIEQKLHIIALIRHQSPAENRGVEPIPAVTGWQVEHLVGKDVWCRMSW